MLTDYMGYDVFIFLLKTVTYHDILIGIIVLSDLLIRLVFPVIIPYISSGYLCSYNPLLASSYIHQGVLVFYFKKPTKNQRCKLSHIFSSYDKLSNKIRRPFLLFSGAFLGRKRAMELRYPNLSHEIRKYPISMR